MQSCATMNRPTLSQVWTATMSGASSAPAAVQRQKNTPQTCSPSHASATEANNAKLTADWRAGDKEAVAIALP